MMRMLVSHLFCGCRLFCGHHRRGACGVVPCGVAIRGEVINYVVAYGVAVCGVAVSCGPQLVGTLLL